MTAPKQLPELINATSYELYKNRVLDLAKLGITSGIEPTEERIEATKINAQRMKRIDKYAEVIPSIDRLLGNLKRPWKWIVLSEAWCGDSAQCLPFIAKIASLSEHIQMQVVMRDENPELMNMYLTKGSRSIPKLICLDTLTGTELGVWGPRPKGIQERVDEYKSQNPDVTHEVFVVNLHLWYALDKGESLQAQFETILAEWINMKI